MKIAYIVNTFPQLSEAFFVNQIVDLIERGHDVRIFALKKGNEPFHEKVYEYNLISNLLYSPSFFLLKNKVVAFIKYLFSHKKNAFKIIKFLLIKSKSTNWESIYWVDSLLCEKFDVIHAHFGNNGVTISDFKKCGLLENVKLLTTFHGYDLQPSSGYLKGYSQLKKFCKHYTVNSLYTKDIVESLGFEKSSITILPVGVDTDYFKPIESKKDKSLFNIIFIGRLVAFKAPDILLRICAELKNQGFDIKCTIIGNGSLKPQLEEMTKKMGLTDIIEFKGGLTQGEVMTTMMKSDLLLLPGITDSSGRAENQGLVVQEAQALELPVIVSDAGGMKEGVQAGITGFVVKEKDIPAFVDKIIYLIHNSDKAKEMGENGRQFVLKNFNTKVLGEKLELIYDSIR